MSVSAQIDVSREVPFRLRSFDGGLRAGIASQMDSPQAHILMVDDSEGIRSIYAHYLTEKGCFVSKAHSVEEALQKAFATQPDLVVLHLWLPKINGWELTRRLKSNIGTKHIPVLVLAGQTLVPPRECDGFLRKPFQLDELGEEIAQRLSTVSLQLR